MRAVVIFNPLAGGGGVATVAAAVEQGLIKRGFEVELRATRRPNDAAEISEQLANTADVIVAVGGDGTVNEVANGMARAGNALASIPSSGASETDTGREAVLGIVPAGTVNVLALELKLPFQIERACDTIAAGNTISLDLGRANDRRFVLMMGAGIDALTVRNIDLRAKKRYKSLAFVSTGLKTGLAEPPPAFLVRAGDGEWMATFFLASNSRYYGGRFGLTPNANLADGELDLVVFTGTTRSSLAVFWLGVPSGLHLRNPHATYLRGQHVELAPLSDRDVIWFQTDGELAGKLPVTVEIDKHALNVLVP